MEIKKVFGIGFHKTGTKSLAEALKFLGYKVTGPNGVDDVDIEKNIIPMVMKLARDHDAFQDNPWPIVFREMDIAFPGSKFILTIRDKEKWIKSVCQHFGQQTTPMRKLIYGASCPIGNEEIYIQRYDEHNKAVLKYFSTRPNDLLVVDFSKGDGWKELCAFLGKLEPVCAFPHVNKAENREKKRSKNIKLGKKIKNIFLKSMKL